MTWKSGLGNLAWLRNLGLALLMSLPAALAAQTPPATDLNSWTPGDQDLRILEVRVKQYTLDGAIFAYQFEDIILLPLGALSEQLDIAIEVGPEVASGFVIREERGFFLDTARAQVTLQGVICRASSRLTTATRYTCCSTIPTSNRTCSASGSA
jgi:hypothetical protein